MVIRIRAAAPVARPSYHRILSATLTAVVAAVAVNALLRAWAVVSLEVPQPEFEPLALGSVVVSSGLSALAAGAAFALLARLVARPVRPFGMLTAVTLLASMAPPIGLLVISPALYPGTRVSWVAVLALMHVVVAALAYWLLALAWRAPDSTERGTS